MNRCVAYIDQNAVLQNIAALRSISGVQKMIVMVKANAYGHGILHIARIIADIPEISFGVATIEEARALRMASVQNAIFLFDGGACCAESEVLIDLTVTPVITHESAAYQLESALQKRGITRAKSIHVKIDTGFHRLGFLASDILAGDYNKLFRHIEESPLLRLDGLATHFCCADLREDNFTDQQVEVFKDCVNYLDGLGINFNCVHMANSAGILRGCSQIAELAHKEWMIRPGLSVYGINPLAGQKSKTLTPALSIEAQVTAIKPVAPGCGVGYGHRFKATAPTWIAVVAMGYGDGLRRILSNRCFVLCRGMPAPIIGTISMDSCTVDITAIIESQGADAVEVGDFVTVVGSEGAHRIDVDTLAQAQGTICYEVLTSFADRMTRTVVNKS